MERSSDFFKAVYVNSSQQYRQSDYGKVIENCTDKTVKLWVRKNERAAAEFAVLCGEKDLKNVRAVSSSFTGESGVIPPELFVAALCRGTA